jgi:hypothetical protein
MTDLDDIESRLSVVERRLDLLAAVCTELRTLLRRSLNAVHLHDHMLGGMDVDDD